MKAASCEATVELTTLESVVRKSALELLEAYGVCAHPVVHRHGLRDALGFAGLIGFTGATLRGTLLIAASSRTLERSNPAPGSPSREWVAELANQLLGRIKNQLLSCGVEIFLTTPLVLRGQHLSIPALRKGSHIELETNDGPIFVVLETESAFGLELVRRHDASVGVEGGAFLF